MPGRTGRGSSLARAGRRAGGGVERLPARGCPPPASAVARSLRLYGPRLSAPAQVVSLRHCGAPLLRSPVCCFLPLPCGPRLLVPSATLAGCSRLRVALAVACVSPRPCRSRAAITSCGAPTPVLVGCGHLRVAPPPAACGPRSPPVPLVASARCGCLRVALSYHAGRARLSPPPPWRAAALLPPTSWRAAALLPPALVDCGHLRVAPPPRRSRAAIASCSVSSSSPWRGHHPPYGRLVLKGAPLRPPCVTGQLDVSRETCAHG